MRKKDKIIILKARIIKLERELKKAQRTCAKQDNELDEYKLKMAYIYNQVAGARVIMDKWESIKPKEMLDSLSAKQLYDSFHKSGLHTESIGKPFNREDLKLNCTKKDIIYLAKESGLPNVTFEPIESTKELFEGKGYVYHDNYGTKCYAIGITDKDQEVLWDDRKEQGKLFNSFEEFKKEYLGFIREELTPIFEPIEKGKGLIKVIHNNDYFLEMKDKKCIYTENIKEAAIFNSFEDFKEKTKQKHWVAQIEDFEFIPIQ